jgi:hypothetical protein
MGMGDETPKGRTRGYGYGGMPAGSEYARPQGNKVGRNALPAKDRRPVMAQPQDEVIKSLPPFDICILIDCRITRPAGDMGFRCRQEIEDHDVVGGEFAYG